MRSLLERSLTGRCIVAAMLIAASPLAAAQQKIVMVTEEWPPFRMNDPSTPSGFSGIDVDLMHALQNRIGVQIEIQRHPWARALEMMRQGQADMITGIAYTDERAAYIRYIPTPYSAVIPVFYARKGGGARIREYNDLLEKTIGFSMNSFYFEPFNSDARLRKVGLSTETQILQMLALGRIDLAIGTDPNISWDVARLGYRDRLEPTSYSPAARTSLYIGLSRRSSIVSLAPAIDEAIKGMLADGSIEKIVGAYR